MSNQKAFYNEEKPTCFTFLEFGSVNTSSGKKEIWDFRLHQEAYDLFMLARYMKDIVECRTLAQRATQDSPEKILGEAHARIFTKDLYNSISKLAALHIIARSSPTQPIEFVELGSTLMGCIDLMSLLQRVGCAVDAAFSRLDLTRIAYSGIDISDLLNRSAHTLYPEHLLKTFLSMAEYEARANVFFAKGVSLLYAIPTVSDFITHVTRHHLGVFDYSLSLGEEQYEHLGTGKRVTFLNAHEIVKEMHRHDPEKRMYIQTSSVSHSGATPKIRGDFIVGSERDVTALIDETIRMKSILLSQISSPDIRAALFFRHQEVPLKNDFMPLEQYINCHK